MTGIIEITLNNKTEQLNFGNYALEKYVKVTGVDIGNVKAVSDDYSQTDMVADIVFAGLYGNARVNGAVFEYSIEEVRKWANDLSMVDQLQVIREFYSCVVKLTNQMQEAFKALSAEAEEEKKK